MSDLHWMQLWGWPPLVRAGGIPNLRRKQQRTAKTTIVQRSPEFQPQSACGFLRREGARVDAPRSHRRSLKIRMEFNRPIFGASNQITRGATWRNCRQMETVQNDYAFSVAIPWRWHNIKPFSFSREFPMTASSQSLSKGTGRHSIFMEAYMASAPGSGLRARYKITLDAGCLRAEMHNRGTAEEIQMFLNTVAGASKVLECGRVLISLDSSIPMSVLEMSDHLAHLNRRGGSSAHKVAILGAVLNPGGADEYVEPSAQQQGLSVRGFADEVAAVQWVRNRRRGQDRRSGHDRHLWHDRRLGQVRRLGQDRRRCQLDEWAI